DAGVRHLFWRVLLVLCLALPIVQPWHEPGAPLSFAASPGAATAGASGTSSPVGLTVPNLAASPVTVRPNLWLDSVMMILAVAAGARLIWLAIGILRLGRLRRTGSVVTEAEVTGNAAALPPVSAEIRYVPAIGQPITFGLRRPVVCLPDTLRTMPSDLRHVVLAHELWHIRRRDWLWLVVEETVRSILWFHPAIQWVVSRVQQSREEAVDELTVLETNSRRAYLEALLAFADGPAPFPVT